LASLAAAVLLAGFTYAAAETRLPTAVRVPTGLLMSLVVPGFTVLAAIAPRLRLALPERALATLAISICADIMCGLVVGGTRIGLTAASITLALTAVTLVGASVAAFWEIRQQPWPAPLCSGASGSVPDGSEADVSTVTPGHRAGWAVAVAVAAGVMAVAVVAGSTLYSQRSAAASHGPSYLSLSALPTQPYGVRVTVTSHEAGPVLVRVTVTEGGSTIASSAGVLLKPGQSWSRPVTLLRATTATSVRTSLFVGASTIPDEETVLTVG
jgi:hypothetical protein